MLNKLNLSLRVFGTVTFLAICSTIPSVQAANVTPDVIFGSGNDNGSFTVGTSNNVEVGLRAKQRFPAANIFNYNGVDTYTFSAGESAPSSGRPLWNFEWSVNTDVSGTSGTNLSDLVYQLKLDTDPGAGTSFTTVFDPILLPYADHAIGNNSTGNGNGTVALDDPHYLNLISNNNVAQNSWAFHWFDLIDPMITGLYRIELAAFALDGQLLSSSGINVQVSAIPLPAALPLYGAGIAVLGFIGWRKRKSAGSSETS